MRFLYFLFFIFFTFSSSITLSKEYLNGTSDIDRLNFIINSKGLRVYDFVPSDPAVFENPPYIGFSLYDKKLAPSVDCFIFDKKGKIEREIYKFDERIELRLQRNLSGRTRINCTAKDKENNWKWFGIQLMSKN